MLGWNSWDIFGTTVTEQQVREQADAMAQHLLPSGYKYLTVDIQWYEPNSKGFGYSPNPVVTMDEYGRLTPGLKKFPSAADGKGFKPLAHPLRTARSRKKGNLPAAPVREEVP